MKDFFTASVLAACAYTGSPFEKCSETGGAFDLQTEECFKDYEEMNAAIQEREQKECDKVGGEWKIFREEETYFQCYRGEPEQDCHIAGKYWDPADETCMTRKEQEKKWGDQEKKWRKEMEEQEKKRCENDGYGWTAGTTTVEGYCNTPEETCSRAEKYWTGQTCITWEAFLKKSCEDMNFVWIETATLGYCNYSLKRVIERIPAQHRAKALASILIDLDLTTLKEIGEPVEEGEKKGDELMKEVMIELARKQGQHAAASSNAGMYAGISFGVIGLVAAGAMFAANNKKQVAENEESLL